MREFTADFIKADHEAKVEAVNAMAEMLQPYYRAGKRQLTMAELETAIDRFSREDANGHPVHPLEHTHAATKARAALEFLENKGYLTLIQHGDFVDSQPGHVPDLEEGTVHGHEHFVSDKTYKAHMPTVTRAVALHPTLDSFDPAKPFLKDDVPADIEATPPEEATATVSTPNGAAKNTVIRSGIERFTMQQQPERPLNLDQVASRHR